MSDERPGDCTITMDEVAGTGFEKSNRAVREEENEDAVGGLLDAARLITKVPGWAVIGAKISILIEEIVDRNQDVLAEVFDNLGNKITAHCNLCWDSVEMLGRQDRGDCSLSCSKDSHWRRKILMFARKSSPWNSHNECREKDRLQHVEAKVWEEKADKVFQNEIDSNRTLEPSSWQKLR